MKSLLFLIVVVLTSCYSCTGKYLYKRATPSCTQDTTKVLKFLSPRKGEIFHQDKEYTTEWEGAIPRYSLYHAYLSWIQGEFQYIQNLGYVKRTDCSLKWTALSPMSDGYINSRECFLIFRAGTYEFVSETFTIIP
jgi:hypothetical protein